MLNKKYYLIFPKVGRILTANSCRLKNDFVIFDAINFQTRQKVHTQWVPKSSIENIAEYDNWNDFFIETNRLIAQAIETDRKTEEAKPKVVQQVMTETQIKDMIKQFPSQVPTVESMQQGLPGKSKES